MPRLALDFTTATLDPRITFTRSGNTATVTNSSGVIALVNADIPRFDYNPATLVCNGLLIEESRTNVLLNSLLDGTSLGTQAVTVTAAARALSFYGTGQVVLSGAHSATVTGTGAYPARATLIFTPTAGVLTLTVTGTVQFAQLELGAFATSFIPTAASQVTRTADVATMTGTNFSDWFNVSAGTYECNFKSIDTTASGRYVINATGTGSAEARIRVSNGQSQVQIFNTAGTTQCNISLVAYTPNTNAGIAFSYQTNYFRAASNGVNEGVDTSGSLDASTNTFKIGNLYSGYVQKINYWNLALTDREVLSISKI